MPVDPVCGIELEEEMAVSLIHNGKSYFFCCEGCKGIFIRKPKKYVRNRLAFC
jgi:YHS domain-containing protein